MPQYTNTAYLSYNGTTRASNTVTGTVNDVLSATKTAVSQGYSNGNKVTFVVNLVNSSSTPFNNLTITDNMGAYDYNGTTLVPLTFTGTGALYINDNATPVEIPVVINNDGTIEISGIIINENAGAQIIYDATVNSYANPNADASINNTVNVSSADLTTLYTKADGSVTPSEDINLNIVKSSTPDPVPANGTLTYTFTISNSGPRDSDANDNITLSDVFNPTLDIPANGVTLTLNDGTTQTLSLDNDYTYNTETGEFEVLNGVISVVAANYVQTQTGTWETTPGTTTVTVTGTVSAPAAPSLVLTSPNTNLTISRTNNTYNLSLAGTTTAANVNIVTNPIDSTVVLSNNNNGEVHNTQTGVLFIPNFSATQNSITLTVGTAPNTYDVTVNYIKAS